jgi:DNA-binding IclR family transcriptional regulator
MCATHSNDSVDEFTTIGFVSNIDLERSTQPIATISAPVFDAQGDVILMVGVHPMQTLGRQEVNAIGRDLTAATAEISHRP